MVILLLRLTHSITIKPFTLTSTKLDIYHKMCICTQFLSTFSQKNVVCEYLVSDSLIGICFSLIQNGRRVYLPQLIDKR